MLFTSLAETIYLLCGGCRPTPQGRARSDRRADHRVSPGAAQHPPRLGLTTLDGRLLTLTAPCSEQQDRWSRRAAGLWVARPHGFQTALCFDIWAAFCRHRPRFSAAHAQAARTTGTGAGPGVHRVGRGCWFASPAALVAVVRMVHE